MLTARGGDLDIVGGLEAGADDYVVKPVEPRVLDARIRAVLRRIARPGSPAETHGELVIDRASLIVRQAGQEVSLTPATSLCWHWAAPWPGQAHSTSAALKPESIRDGTTGGEVSSRSFRPRRVGE
jgi:two-component system, OmpR family, response regulator MtrA